MQAMQDIRLERIPISQSRSEDRDHTYQIILDGKTTISFSRDCEICWVTDGVKPSFSYQVEEPYSVWTCLEEFIPMVMPVNDRVMYDIDNDGISEECFLCPGITYGICTISLYAWEDGAEQPEYENVIAIEPCQLSFTESEDGKLQLRGEGYWQSDAIRYYDVELDEGSIWLFENGTNPSSSSRGLIWFSPPVEVTVPEETVGAVPTDFREISEIWVYDGSADYSYLVISREGLWMLFTEQDQLYASGQLTHGKTDGEYQTATPEGEAVTAILDTGGSRKLHMGSYGSFTAAFWMAQTLPADHLANRNYSVSRNGAFYAYWVANENWHIMLADFNTREPAIRFISEDILSLSVQTGTGASTRWTAYCDIGSSTVSKTYMYVLGEYRNNVIYCDYQDGEHFIKVRDIFGLESDAVRTILPEVYCTDPVVDFQVTEAGIARITYLKGEIFAETTVEIDLT